jgi:hypothetical protein
MGLHDNETLCSVKRREFIEILHDLSSQEELLIASV